MERIYNFINYNQFHEAERLIRITQTSWILSGPD